MALFRRVLVAVDLDTPRPEIVSYARVLSRLSSDVECRFVHVLAWPARSAMATYSQTLDRLKNLVAQDYGGQSAVCQVLHGNLIDQLLATAAETGADLILVGHQAGHSKRRSTARRLAMKAPCSVWMRPDGGPKGVRGVIAAVDFSLPSAEALTTAARIARNLEMDECLALHVYFNDAIPEQAEEQIQDARVADAFRRFVAPLDVQGMRVRRIIDESPNVAHSIQRIAQREQADLVVMGSRGQSRSASILLGSESEHLLMETEIPVLVVKRRGERIGLLEALLDRELPRPETLRFG